MPCFTVSVTLDADVKRFYINFTGMPAYEATVFTQLIHSWWKYERDGPPEVLTYLHP